MKTTYEEIYKKKVRTAEDAARIVRDGDEIEMGFGTVFPVDFDRALAARAEELHHVSVRNGVLFDRSRVLAQGAPFEWQSWHGTGDVRRAFDKGIACHIPVRYSELIRYVTENRNTDVLAISVAPMDAHGYFNFGLDGSHFLRQAQRAKTVIVEVNEKQPRVFGRGESEIPIEQVDVIIEGKPHDMAALANRPYGDLDRKIAERVVERMEDGSTLQLGIGALPNAIGDVIAGSSLKDLGVHTELYVDSFMKMTLAGKVTGMEKSLDRGRQVSAFLAGTEALYDFVNENPEIQVAPVDYVNSAAIIAAQHKMVSINTAIQVNLRGEVSSESVGARQISGSGGQFDFAVGSYAAPGGKGFICLRSSRVDKAGVRHSNIVPDFSAGTIVTMPASTTHYVVTEYGICNLKGKSQYERARALVSIAHPDFREALTKAAVEKGFWRE
ncbi:MAG: acetyl-CoA hydrolase/transferase C-terminal domain-containing protein [Peptoniphilus sp.]|nr:acetyl-CoA hydrolase/transferase C-terminal domain-containing protein [Peptoniphilus sp.]MDY3119081.1 acetyl-CoA hydrolase/transferase C-terminal domain-containing protein [Peptoniphilus sp.]